MLKPLVSIVIPVYKVQENNLRRCIESCIAQSLKNIEIIIVDDGSPDNCGKICDEYARKDERIKVVHKKNGGLVSARNAGWEASTGEWFTFVDGDDWISLDTCEKLHDAIHRNPDTDMFFWKCVIELPQKTIKGKFEWSCTDHEKVYEGEECRELARQVLVYEAGLSSVCVKLINRDYAVRNKIIHNPTLKQGIEGYDFSFRSYYNAKKTVYLNEYFYHYRYNENGISKSVSEINTQYITDGFNVLYEDIKMIPDNRPYIDALELRICYVLIAIALNSYFHPDNKDSVGTRCRKFAKVIADNPIYDRAIKNADIFRMRKSRRITAFFIRHKVYIMLELVSRLKQLMLKIGYYSY